MKKANIYIQTDSSSPKKSMKRYGYVLGTDVSGREVTREGFGKIEATYHQSVLAAMIKAFARFKEECEIQLHTEDAFVLNMLEKNLAMWAGNGFRTAKGKEVANKQEWEELWELVKKHTVVCVQGTHEYSSWLTNEMRKDERYV